jgi:hypothetical protein
MKSLLSLLFVSFAAFVQATPALKPLCDDEKVTLPSGTLVLLETNEQFSSGQAVVGQLVQFKVRTHVMAEGEVAIATGALAIGRIKAIEPSTYNNPEMFKIEITYVQAVDGQQIPLNGNELSIKGQFPGQAAMGDPGTSLTATVMNDTRIKI